MPKYNTSVSVHVTSKSLVVNSHLNPYSNVKVIMHEPLHMIYIKITLILEMAKLIFKIYLHTIKCYY